MDTTTSVTIHSGTERATLQSMNYSLEAATARLVAELEDGEWELLKARRDGKCVECARYGIIEDAAIALTDLDEWTPGKTDLAYSNCAQHLDEIYESNR